MGFQSFLSGQTVKWTVLHHPQNTKWSHQEVSELTENLMAVASGCVQQPADIIILGHFTKEQIQEALPGMEECLVTQITNSEDASLPFKPLFI